MNKEEYPVDKGQPALDLCPYIESEQVELRQKSITYIRKS